MSTWVILVMARIPCAESDRRKLFDFQGIQARLGCLAPGEASSMASPFQPRAGLEQGGLLCEGLPHGSGTAARGPSTGYSHLSSGPCCLAREENVSTVPEGKWYEKRFILMQRSQKPCIWGILKKHLKTCNIKNKVGMDFKAKQIYLLFQFSMKVFKCFIYLKVKLCICICTYICAIYIYTHIEREKGEREWEREGRRGEREREREIYASTGSLCKWLQQQGLVWPNLEIRSSSRVQGCKHWGQSVLLYQVHW